ncbi:hypothetical protein [Crenothrix sp.]|uniref:hypothetical protein n=1 Tax=Crenothrix sp. TaxID=3100433 RepID=UPI00374CA409
MINQYKLFFLSAIVLAVTVGCAATTVQEKPTESSSQLNSYPTRDRVEYVLNCIAEHGGLNYISQYACGCKIDKIAEQMSFEEFDTAKTFSNLRGVAGESGAAFRDPKQSKDLKKRLKEAEASAEKSCFVK